MSRKQLRKFMDTIYTKMNKKYGSTYQALYHFTSVKS